MDFSFTVYEPKKRTRVRQTEPKAEVTTKGRIIFNKIAKELLEGKPYCMLAYDKTNKAIGVLPAQNKDINSFPIRYTARGAYIGAKKFFVDTGLLPNSNIESTPENAEQYIAVKV